MRVWRIARKPYALDRTGTGASLIGGRWNSPGIPALYAAINPATAGMEKLVHAEVNLPKDLVLTRIDLPEGQDLYEQWDIENLPDGWDTLSSSPAATAVGDAFLNRGEKLGLIVPSVVIPEELNIVINPNHPAFTQATLTIVRDFKFDPRLRPK